MSGGNIAMASPMSIAGSCKSSNGSRRRRVRPGPLLRPLVADLDAGVRHVGADVIEGVAASDKDATLKLYKPLVNDADPVARSKASGQLARLVPPPPAIRPVSCSPVVVPNGTGLCLCDNGMR
jgi:hypothetical protein